MVVPVTVCRSGHFRDLGEFRTSSRVTWRNTLRFFIAFLQLHRGVGDYRLGPQLAMGLHRGLQFRCRRILLVAHTPVRSSPRSRDNLPTVDYIGGFGPDLDILPFLASDQWFPFLVRMVVAASDLRWPSVYSGNSYTAPAELPGHHLHWHRGTHAPDSD